MAGGEPRRPDRPAIAKCARRAGNFGTPIDVAAGLSILVDVGLEVGEEVGYPLGFVEDDLSVVAPEKGQWILLEGFPVGDDLEGDVAVATEELLEQGSLARLAGTGKADHREELSQLFEMAGQVAGMKGLTLCFVQR